MTAGAAARLDTDDLRRRISRADEALAARFWAGEEVTALVRERARFIDAFLAEVWQHWFQHNDNLALLAVGGYGRGELHPHSDIDLLILARKPHAVREEIAAFVRLLWDLRLDIGHSVRTLADCKREAALDLTVATTMLERRRLAGSHRLTAKLDQLFARRGFWPSAKFFRGKQAEQAERHQQFDDMDYGLEPNIKSSPGGLRDIQTVQWIILRHQGAAAPTEPGAAEYLTAQERDWLEDGKRFLWRVRFGLHLIAARREDRLLFDHQRELARRFGYRDTAAQLAVEQFMHDYYRHVLLLREVNDILLQHFDEAILRAGERPRIEPVNERFRIRNGYMEATSETVFAEQPAALMELFVRMAHRRDVQGVRAATIRLVREHLHLIDEEYRRDPQANEYFLALLRAPHTLVSQLTRMRRYGVLGRYLPAFGKVVGQMQHDLFHIYTVDAHTMMVIRQMRRFRQPAAEEKFPLAAAVARALPKVELLYIAGLFHDIGKGRGGDHSTLGAEDAVAFCRRHRLSEEDTALVAWLVRDHLAMSATAQRQDIADPAVIAAFAQRVETETRLNYLYALTVADINATNPTLWNSWRATLMRQLYDSTRAALRRGRAALPDGMAAADERSRQVAAKRAEALEAFPAEGDARERIAALWDDVAEEFFLHHSAAQIAAITRAVDGHDPYQGALATVVEGEGAEGATELFLYATDRDGLFADSVAAIDGADLRIAAAWISTTSGGMCFNSYMILNPAGRPLAAGAGKRLARALAKAVDGGGRQGAPSRRVSRQLKHFVMPTEVHIDAAPGARTSTLRVVASDRPGLLAALGGLFAELDISIHSARITTLGERVEDVFEITNRAKRAITHSGHAHTLAEAIRARLDAEVAHA